MVCWLEAMIQMYLSNQLGNLLLFMEKRIQSVISKCHTRLCRTRETHMWYVVSILRECGKLKKEGMIWVYQIEGPQFEWYTSSEGKPVSIVGFLSSWCPWCIPHHQRWVLVHFIHKQVDDAIISLHTGVYASWGRLIIMLHYTCLIVKLNAIYAHAYIQRSCWPYMTCAYEWFSWRHAWVHACIIIKHILHDTTFWFLNMIYAQAYGQL